MLFERRAYTLRPGSEDAFWKLQLKWNTPGTFKPLLERNVGYFTVAAGPGERIIHLYRWDDYDDGKRRLTAIAGPERAEYFAAARALLLRQENALLDRAPIAELNPLWSGDRDWLPGSPAFENVGDATALAVVFLVTTGLLHRVIHYHWHHRHRGFDIRYNKSLGRRERSPTRSPTGRRRKIIAES